MITDLPQAQNLLQDPDVILHHFVFVRQLVKLSFGFRKELVVNRLFVRVELEIAEFISTRWKIENSLSVGGFGFLGAAEGNAFHDGL